MEGVRVHLYEFGEHNNHSVLLIAGREDRDQKPSARESWPRDVRREACLLYINIANNVCDHHHDEIIATMIRADLNHIADFVYDDDSKLERSPAFRGRLQRPPA